MFDLGLIAQVVSCVCWFALVVAHWRLIIKSKQMESDRDAWIERNAEAISERNDLNAEIVQVKREKIELKETVKALNDLLDRDTATHARLVAVENRATNAESRMTELEQRLTMLVELYRQRKPTKPVKPTKETKPTKPKRLGIWPP